MGSGCVDAASNASAKKIAQACEEHFAANKTDCNKFLKAGATALDVKGIPLGEPTEGQSISPGLLDGPRDPAEGQSISPGRKNPHVGNCDRAAKRTLNVG